MQLLDNLSLSLGLDNALNGQSFAEASNLSQAIMPNKEAIKRLAMIFKARRGEILENLDPKSSPTSKKNLDIAYSILQPIPEVLSLFINVFRSLPEIHDGVPHHEIVRNPTHAELKQTVQEVEAEVFSLRSKLLLPISQKQSTKLAQAWLKEAKQSAIGFREYDIFNRCGIRTATFLRSDLQARLQMPNHPVAKRVVYNFKRAVSLGASAFDSKRMDFEILIHDGRSQRVHEGNSSIHYPRHHSGHGWRLLYNVPCEIGTLLSPGNKEQHKFLNLFSTYDFSETDPLTPEAKAIAIKLVRAVIMNTSTVEKYCAELATELTDYVISLIAPSFRFQDSGKPITLDVFQEAQNAITLFKGPNCQTISSHSEIANTYHPKIRLIANYH